MRVIGWRRRSAASASWALVAAFSFFSNASWACCHSAAETMRGIAFFADFVVAVADLADAGMMITSLWPVLTQGRTQNAGSDRGGRISFRGRKMQSAARCRWPLSYPSPGDRDACGYGWPRQACGPVQ